jgi:hypothetical protein
MRDDPDFNILFVSLIEKYRCLFDSSSAEYGNRNIQDRAWDKIAHEVTATGEFTLRCCKILRNWLVLDTAATNEYEKVERCSTGIVYCRCK